MPRVLVTRPRYLAEPLAKKLKMAGYGVLVEPLFSIGSLAEERPALPGAYVVMITSQAVFVGLELRRAEVQDLLDVPCFAVGAKTAEAAKAFGFKRVMNSDGDSVALAQMIAQHVQPGVVLHISGEDIADQGHAFLKNTGFSVIRWPVYTVVEVQDMSPFLQKAIEREILDVALFFSPRTATAFVRQATQSQLIPHCSKMCGVVMSEAVASALKPLNMKKIVISDKPSEEALIITLNRFTSTPGAFK